ncbi:MAG TPA: hypothetical protein PKO06_16850, partial [Candidatus Ozemobacteraceae bacterium]|nr:hypothetical protein [Candidatus Ozemobacteraceae bacterium]
MRWFRNLRRVLLCVSLLCLPLEAAVRINTILCDRTNVSKGQTGIEIYMEVENLDAAPATLVMASLTFSLGSYEVTLNNPSLGSAIPGLGKTTCVFTLSVDPLSPSGVCVIDGSVQTSGGNDNSSDLTHSWSVQQPSELVITSIVGPSEVNRGSADNQAIMDVARTGEADVNLNHVDLTPLVPTNYTNWIRTSPTLPQNFAKAYWWNPRWQYRRQLTIANRSTSTLPTRYEIAFSFDHAALITAGKSLPSGDDIRIVYDNGTAFQEIPRYLDPMQSAWASSTTTIWFPLQEPLGPAPAATQRYTLYYGASIMDAALPPANPANVFIFSDDCENGANGWTTNFLAGYPTTRWELGPTGPQPGGDPDGLTHPPNTTIYWPTGAYSPNNCWATDLDGYYRGRNPAAEVVFLYSPTIDLRDTLNPTLTFYNFLDVEDPTTPFDWGTLRIRQESAPRPGPVLRTLLNRHIDETETGWRQESFSLLPELGKQAYLEFALRVDQLVLGYGWAIDDIRVRQIAVPEPNNPLLGVEEIVPSVPTIKAYFDVDVSPTA